MSNFRKINKQEYKGMLDKVLFRTFFHDIKWHEFLEKEFKWLRFEYYLYNDELLFPVVKIGEKMVSLPFCEYGGPLPLKQGAYFEKFKNDVLQEFQNIKIKFHPKVGEGTSDISTHWIENLNNTSEQELLNSFRKTLRHEIQNAQKNNVQIKKCINEKELKQFYDLYVDNLRRKRTIPYPWGIIQFLYQNAPSELLLALYKGKIIGGDLFLKYGNFVHYFLSASNYKYRNFSAAHLLLWTKIKSLIGQDIIFDLGATPRNSSLNIFKAGWGGKEYPILQIGIKREDESLRSSRLRKFWQLLPNYFIKKLSPYLIKYRL